MELTIEQQVFSTHFNLLVTSTQSCVLPIANKCRSKNLIVQDVVDQVLYVEATPGKKTSILLKAVQDCMNHNHACFEEFLAILETESVFNDLIEQLRSSKKEAVSLSQDQVVPGGSDDDLFDIPTEQTEEFVVRRRKWKDSGFQSASSDGPDAETVLVSHPSGTKTQTSRDSGISRGSSADLNEPVQETSEGHESSSPVDGHHQQQTASVGSSVIVSPEQRSPRIRAIDRLTSILQNLRMETKQQDAMEVHLKEKVDSLTQQLSDTVEEKKQTEEALEKKEAIVKSLEQQQEKLHVSLATKESELEELKLKLSNTEADRDELNKTCTQYEQDIESLKSKLAKVSAEHNTELKELEETKEILKDQSEYVNKLRSDILASEQKNSELSLKCASASSDRMCMDRLMLCFLVAIVLCCVIILYLVANYVYNRTDTVACTK